MVGGGRDAFIGAVHRQAIALDGQVELVAGALSASAGEGRGLGPRPVPGRRPQPRRLAGAARRRAEAAGRRAHRLRRRSSRPTTCTTRSRRPSSTPASTSSATSRWCTRASRPMSWSRRSRAQGTVSASPTTTPATRWCARRARWCARGEIGEIRKVVGRIQPGLARDAARRRGQQAGRLAQRPGAQRRRPAPSATSARMPRTWSRPSPACEIESLCADLSALGAGPAARRRRQPAAALRGRRARRADRLAGQRRAGERPAPARLRHARHAWYWRQEQPSELVHSAARRPAPHPHARLALAVRGGAAREPPAERASRRASSRPSRMSTAAWSRTSARGSRARRPIRWRPTTRAWKTARAACDSSNARWPRRAASRNGPRGRAPVARVGLGPHRVAPASRRCRPWRGLPWREPWSLRRPLPPATSSSPAPKASTARRATSTSTRGGRSTRAVITHAHADHARVGHRPLPGAHRQRRHAAHAAGRRSTLQTLAYGEPIVHHGVRVSLHPAGHVLGSAQVRHRARRPGLGRLRRLQDRARRHLRALRAGALRHLHHRVDLRPADLSLADPGGAVRRDRRLVARQRRTGRGSGAALLCLRQGAAHPAGRRCFHRADRGARRGRAAERACTAPPAWPCRRPCA